jgi:hypothetical protein
MLCTWRGSLLWRAYRKQARDAAWLMAGSTANFTQRFALFLFFESFVVPLLAWGCPFTPLFPCMSC